MILDDGDRTQFDSGAVRDIKTNKGRCDLMPLAVVAHVLNDSGDYDVANILYKLDEFVETGSISVLYDVVAKYISSVLHSDPISAFLDVSHHFEEGAMKYGERNWERGIPTHSYLDSAVRHLLKLSRGDSDESHDRAFLWNIMCLIWTLKHNSSMDDISQSKGRSTVSTLEFSEISVSDS